ncbi:hypothetical protein CPB84DRAFT_1761066 [Gymnopilus junonius]|uniref:Uncharacterized protein n=1 Tax=Gymnopilus junonius TaxID=109634 RepID=A0A9P5NXK5_GYMJU|nr:hypothetical protein CPB84DRAFT_1761066 [Gymnopilus junonius]
MHPPFTLLFLLWIVVQCWMQTRLWGSIGSLGLIITPSCAKSVLQDDRALHVSSRYA